MTTLGAAAVGLYVVLLLAMLAYGANSFLLTWVHWRQRRRSRPALPEADTTRFVTVQLPIYNERLVAERVLDAASRLDWPREQLEIQVLDDSTDDTSERLAARVAELRSRGVPVVHLRRRERRGFKAGALADGMSQSRGEFFAIFDADFVPPPDFLRRAMRHLHNPEVAAIQGRWTHLNRESSRLTRAQALAIDGHFGVEQAARAWAGWLLNFNGTAGVWRREAIEDAGGWSADTLTEDLDLSYRVQLTGRWRLAYDTELTCPAELPTDLQAFKAQQRRWATGSMQTARKLLGPVWRSSTTLGAKLQATLHLTHYAVHPLIGLTALLSVPCVLLPSMSASPQSLWALLLPFALAMSGPTVLYLYGQRALGRRALPEVRSLGALTLIGIGIAVSNARAVIAAFRSEVGEFERTPKRGDARASGPTYRTAPDRLRWLEGSLALYCLASAIALTLAGVYVIAPFMLLDAAGFAAVAGAAGLGARS